MRATIIGVAILIAFVFAISVLYPLLAEAPPQEQTPQTPTRRIYGEPPVIPATSKQLAQDNIAFGMDLYEQFREQDGNLFFSPYSISEAFAILYAGARGETAEEMKKVLHISLDDDDLHEAYRDIADGFDKRIRESDDEKLKLSIANGLWTQEGFPIRDDYVTLLQHYHNSEPASLDFLNDAEQSYRTINDWISDKTEGMIKDILPQSAITPQTQLILANTIYFEARWRGRFLNPSTKDGEFHRLDNTTVTIPLMHDTTFREYYETSKWQAAELPYRMRNLGMLILLPRSGNYHDVEQMLDSEFLSTLDDSLHEEYLDIRFPKFTFTSESLNLNKTLMQLGMSTAFSDDADFSGISVQALTVSDAFHKASVSVDEEGTVAAGATAIRSFTGLPSEKPEPIEFNVNRPFIFLIRDFDTKAVLFMGRVLDPTE